MSHRALLVAFVTLPLAACSGENPGTAGTGGAGGVFDPGGEVKTYELSAGPFNVQPGQEQTVCITKSLGNPEGGFVRRFRATLNNGSHHMILYRSSETVEDLNPVPCQGFSGLITGDHPIFIAQQADAELVFPTEGETPVAFEIQPNQMLRIEVHYINPTTAPLDVTGTASVDAIPLSSTVIASDLAFWGTANLNGGGSPPDQDIPPNSAGDTGPKFQAGIAGTKTFAVTTHQHHLGTRMRVWHATDANDTSNTPVCESTNWADPTLAILTPPLEFPENGGSVYSDMGFAYRCEWNNTTSQTISFGEGANDEMCFLWHYYYPSQGFQLCMDSFCRRTD